MRFDDVLNAFVTVVTDPYRYAAPPIGERIIWVR